MDSAHWARIQELFHAAAELPRSERSNFLNTACAGDEGLLAEVSAMLEQDAAGASLLDRNVASVAENIFETSLSGRQFGPYRLR